MRLVRALISVVLAVALLFAVFLLWRRFSEDKFGKDEKTVVADGNVMATVPVDMNSESSSDGISFTVHITEAQLAVLIEKALSEKIAVENVGVKIGEGGNIAVSFLAATQDLAALLLASGKELPGILRFGVSLLGDTIEVDIASVVSAAYGKVVVEPTAFGILGLSIGVNGLPETIVDAMNAEINNYISENIGNVTSIETAGNIMTVSGNLNT